MSNLLIEGVDRLGKGTLINGLRNERGAMLVIHYQKPEVLDCYVESNKLALTVDAKNKALEQYQRASFAQMFNMLSACPMGLIMDRAHLGEVVYSKRYRNYDGEYVFEYEQIYGGVSLQKDLLILLVASDLTYLQDDGLSFDFMQREDEQLDFIAAFEKSGYRNKVMIDVTQLDAEGKSLKMHAAPGDILQAVLELQRIDEDAGYQKVTFIKTADGKYTTSVTVIK